MLASNVLDGLRNWLDTLSPPRSMAGNSAALRMELETLAKTIERAGIKTRDQLDAVFEQIKSEADTRSWPTAKEIISAAAKVRGDGAQDPSRGDRNKLSHDELSLLEGRVLPTARRWLGLPELAEHGAKTLEYWGESFVTPQHLLRKFGGAE